MGIPSVVIEKIREDLFRAIHIPSGKQVEGHSMPEAEEAMRQLIGLSADGNFAEAPTSGQFEGLAQEIALFLEGDVSASLAIHAGFARLEAFRDGIAEVRLGGGCEGCPASLMTLVHGVRSQLQERFGEDQVVDVIPTM